MDVNVVVMVSYFRFQIYQCWLSLVTCNQSGQYSSEPVVQTCFILKSQAEVASFFPLP